MYTWCMFYTVLQNRCTFYHLIVSGFRCHWFWQSCQFYQLALRTQGGTFGTFPGLSLDFLLENCSPKKWLFGWISRSSLWCDWHRLIVKHLTSYLNKKETWHSWHYIDTLIFKLSPDITKKPVMGKNRWMKCAQPLKKRFFYVCVFYCVGKRTCCVFF